MRVAIIGVGRMGSVFARVLSRWHEVALIDRDSKIAHDLAAELGALALKEPSEARKYEIVIVAVKPAQVEEVVRSISDAPLIVSCAAGVPIKKLEHYGAKKIIRIMPNICAEYGEAVIAYSLHPESEDAEKKFLTVFKDLGLCLKCDESHLDPITAASGSGPAFIAFFAEAMIDEAVAQGITREVAQKIVAQTLVGTGRLMLNGWATDKIKETVASPGGTTEAGLKMLQSRGTNHAIHEAIRFATNKAREIGK